MLKDIRIDNKRFREENSNFTSHYIPRPRFQTNTESLLAVYLASAVRFHCVLFLKIFLEILVTVSAHTKDCRYLSNSGNFSDFGFLVGINTNN